MFFSIRNSLGALLAASLCIQAVAAVSAASTELELTKRTVNISPCYHGGVLGNGSPLQAAKDWHFTSAPWFPNCMAIPQQEGQIKCLGCMALAGAAYYTALGGCTAASPACAVGVWACESVCIAIATYALWTAEQACYCEHADCSDYTVRNKGKIGGPPQITISGQNFQLPLPPGWGYVGTRSVNIVSFGPQWSATTC